MSDDTSTPDGTEEPPVDPEDDVQDPHDADTSDADTTPNDDDDVDPAELRTRLEEAEAEAARYKRRLIAADLRKKQVEKELRELRGTKTTPTKDEPGKTPDDRDERDAEIERLKAQVAATRVRDQFDSIDKYQWQNPSAAYRLLDLDDVRQEDGTVDRDDLQDAVDALAKANPYLLKTPETPKRAERPTGQQPGSHRRDRTVKQDFASAFSALRARN